MEYMQTRKKEGILLVSFEGLFWLGIVSYFKYCNLKKELLLCLSFMLIENLNTTNLLVLIGRFCWKFKRKWKVDTEPKEIFVALHSVGCSQILQPFGFLFRFTFQQGVRDWTFGNKLKSPIVFFFFGGGGGL